MGWSEVVADKYIDQHNKVKNNIQEPFQVMGPSALFASDGKYLQSAIWICECISLFAEVFVS